MAELYVCEYFPAVNYCQFLHILNAFHAEKCSQKITFNKQHFKDLLSIAQNDRERECIRYTAFAVSGLSATGARKHFGLEHMTERAERVQRTIEEAKAIRSAIQSISETQKKVALAEFGIQMSDESDSGTDSDVTEDSDIDLPQHPSVTPQDTDLIQLLQLAEFNWFEFICQAEVKGISRSVLDEQFENMCSKLSELECKLVKQSHAAFLLIEGDELLKQREASALNGEIVSESDSDNPDNYTGISSLSSERAKVIIKKKVAAICRKNRRERVKMISERNFLLRKKARG